MEWLQYWYAFPVAVAVATMAMSSGVGGGLVFAPFFLLVLKLSPGQALGTSLLTEVFGMGTGFINYFKLRLIDFNTGLTLLLGSIPGAILGALLINLNFIHVFYLKIVFGVTIILFAFTIIPRRKREPELIGEGCQRQLRTLTDAGGNQYSYWIAGGTKLVLMSFLAGIGVGTIAIGSGEINTPKMISSGVPSRIAVPTSVFVMAVTVFSATSIYAFNGQPVLPLALYTCSGVVVGARLGTMLVNRVSETLLKKVLFMLFLLIGLFILMQTLVFEV